ncbi:hypothetical protein V494_00002 [Pseudogymnoascus sp. VKM F-4513 (FW-928)]|nr:hypothetical protein V494_00002 [Pseudogymnoascus sp. VKM F-4513 (FW-928)]
MKSTMDSKRSAMMGGSKPFPAKQLFILSLCRICEPIAFMSIFPYIYAMIESFGFKNGDPTISMYAGVVTAAFTFAEFSSGMLWGKLSDRIGRKPVLLTGLAGTGLSMLVFGFARNIYVAIIARALGGLLNGNIGVLQTTVAELATVKEHQPRAYSIMPFVWSLGSIMGPVLGGALAEPCKHYPSLFPRGTIFERFPFLLPNLFCTSVVILGVLVGFFFLEETHHEKKYERDVGLEFGKRIVAVFRRTEDANDLTSEKNIALMSETESLIDEFEQLPRYQSTEASPQIPVTSQPEILDIISLDNNDSEPEKVVALKPFTRQIILNIAGYGILAYHTITFDQLLPLFLASPEHKEAVISLPFKFLGGWAMSTKDIGFILMAQGAYSMFATVVLFPFAVKRLGPLNLFKLVAFSYPVLYIITPYVILLPEQYRLIGLVPLLAWKTTFANFAFPATNILLANTAPSLLLLGTINGAASSTASFCRGLGPIISGSLYSLGFKVGYFGLVWWFTAIISVAGAAIAMRMSEKGFRKDEEEVVSDEEGAAV